MINVIISYQNVIMCYNPKIDESTTSSLRSGINAKHMVMAQAAPSNRIIQFNENYVNNQNFAFHANEHFSFSLNHNPLCL